MFQKLIIVVFGYIYVVHSLLVVLMYLKKNILQKKVSAHARQREHFTSGEWSTGNKWADDKPRENVDGEAINLITSGACGAFVHGLEDEYLGELCLLLTDMLIKVTIYRIIVFKIGMEIYFLPGKF